MLDGELGASATCFGNRRNVPPSNYYNYFTRHSSYLRRLLLECMFSSYSHSLKQPIACVQQYGQRLSTNAHHFNLTTTYSYIHLDLVNNSSTTKADAVKSMGCCFLGMHLFHR